MGGFFWKGCQRHIMQVVFFVLSGECIFVIMMGGEV